MEIENFLQSPLETNFLSSKPARGLQKISDNIKASTSITNGYNMTEAGSIAHKNREDSSETTSDREISQNFAFLLELIISLQKNNKDIPVEELLSIENELFNYLAQIKIIGHDQWLATRLLANLLSNKIVGTNTKEEIAGKDMLRCLDIFEKSFFYAGKLSLNAIDTEQIAGDKETYLNILDLWICQNIDAIASEENQGVKSHAIKILEERILKGKLYGNTSHKKYNNLDVMLKTARGLLQVRTQKSSMDATVLIDANATSILPADVTSELPGNITEEAITAQETILNPLQKVFNRFQFLNYSVSFRLSSASMVVFVCLIVGTVFFLFRDKSAEDLPKTQQPPAQSQTTTKSPAPAQKIEIVTTTPVPQAEAPTPPIAATVEKIAAPQPDDSLVPTHSPDKVDSQAVSSNEENSTATQKIIPDNSLDNKDRIPSFQDEQQAAAADVKISTVKDNTTESTIADKGIGKEDQAATSISVAPEEPVKKPIQVEKASADIKNQCAALYVKLSLGKMLNKNETKFLSSNCK